MSGDDLNLSCSGMWVRRMVGNRVAAASAVCVKMVLFICAWRSFQGIPFVNHLAEE